MFNRYALTAALVAALSSVASQADERSLRPAPTSLNSAFHRDDPGLPTPFGAYISALLAQQQNQADASADFYQEAVDTASDSPAVVRRAFFQFVYSGRIADAASVASQFAAGDEAGGDLGVLVPLVGHFAAGEWDALHGKAAVAPRSGLSAFLVPILEAWAHAARGDGMAAQTALDPLEARGGFTALVAEQRAYLADFLGDRDTARASYQSLTDTDRPATLQPYVQYAALLARTESRSAAQAFLETTMRRFGGNQFLAREGQRIMAGRGPSLNAAHPMGAVASILYRLASEFVRGNSRQAAVFYLRVAEYLQPQHDDIKVTLGAQFEELDDYLSAARTYGDIATDSPLASVARQRRISALRQLEDKGLVMSALDAALDLEPESFAHRLSHADILREEGAYEKAVAVYSDLIAEDRPKRKSDWYLYFARGVCFDQMDDWGKAEADMLTALGLSPDEPTTLNYLGYSWIDRDMNHARATEMIEKALAARPDDGFINDSLGWVHYLQGDYGSAIEYLELAVSLEPTDAVINDHLGDAYWQAGRRVEARYQWRQVLQSNPEDDVRTAALEKLRRGLNGKS